MPGTVVTSLAAAYRRGLYILFKKAIAAAQGVGTGRAVIIASLPWGPYLTQTPFESAAVFRSKFAPEGSTRTGSGYNMVVNFPWTDLQVIRVLGVGYATASGNLQKGGPANCVAVTAKYPGALGNSIVCTVADSSDGVANSFKLTITLTNSTTGDVTTEVYDQVDSTQTGAAYWLAVTANSILVAGLVKSAVGRPTNGATTLSTGSDGAALVASDYVGTPGSADKGIALMEKDPDVAFFFCDDVGAGILATVNAAMKAHRLLMNDRRIALITGNPLETDTTAKTNAALNQDEGTFYVFPHGLVADEDATSDTSTKITIPLTAPLASIASLMQPHLSPAFKDSDFTRALSAILSLDAGTGTPASLDLLEKAGVLPFERNSDGVFSPYSSTATDKTTAMWEFRMKRYIAFSLTAALDSYRNGPNEDQTQGDIESIVETFLRTLVENRKIDPIFRPCINDFQMVPREAVNTDADINAGDFTVGFLADLVSEMKRIILSGEIGASVTITSSAA